MARKGRTAFMEACCRILRLGTEGRPHGHWRRGATPAPLFLVPSGLAGRGRQEGRNCIARSAMLMVGFAVFLIPVPTFAQLAPTPSTFGGDIFSRPRLTGNWGGLRDELAKKGVTFDLDLAMTPQAVTSGGFTTGSGFWGNVDYTLNVDTGKLGLWPGGFLKVQADTGFGNNVFRDVKALVPVNTAALYPAPGDDTTALTNLTFMQFLSTKFGLMLGKFNMLDANKNEFYGDYNTQFMNAALQFPMALDLVPLSAYGAGAIAIPLPNILLTLLALDPSGTATSNDVGSTFSDGVTLVGSGKLTIKPFGMLGHQNLGFSWSSKERVSLIQSPSNILQLLLFNRFPRLAAPGPILERILERFFPNLLNPTQPLNRSSSSWSFTYAFDQYFWHLNGDPTRGLGVFFMFGASDGNPNPVQYSFAAGIGGKGITPGRPHDSFGIGLARTGFSSDFVSYMRQRLNLGLAHEDAIEMYYNAALTPWLGATADLQIVNPGLNKALDSYGHLANVTTAVVLGARIRVRF